MTDFASQYSFNHGEFGKLMSGRVDLDEFSLAATVVENWQLTSQGPLVRRIGSNAVADLTADVPNCKAARLIPFVFDTYQQNLLVFRANKIQVYQDFTTASGGTILATPWDGTEVHDLRYVQSFDSLFLVHKDHPPQVLRREGANRWILEQLDLNPAPFVKFATQYTATPSATTGAIVITLTPPATMALPPGYWTTEQIPNTIRIGTKRITITGFPSDATGGTALASSGTAANAWDGSTITRTTNTSANGYLGYDFGVGNTATIRMVAIKSQVTGTLTLDFQTDNNTAFTSPTTLLSQSVPVVAGTYKFVNLPIHTGERCWRMKETGGATLDIQEMVINKGFRVNGTVVDTLASTTANADWDELAFSAAHGYPQTVAFLGERLVFGGRRDQPGVVYMSDNGDIYAFHVDANIITTDPTINDGNAIVIRVLSEQSHRIRDMKQLRNGLAVFTSMGEFEIKGSSATSAITPSNIFCSPQTRYGISDVPVQDVDGVMVFVAEDRGCLRTFSYDFASDQYTSESLNVWAHEIFDVNKEPRSSTVLKNFQGSCGHLIAFAREDGQLALLSKLDDENIRARVRGWGRWISARDGKFGDACVVRAIDDEDLGSRPTMFVLVERVVGAATKVFLEAFCERNIQLDHWAYGQDDIAKTTWAGFSTMAGEVVSVLGDGTVRGDFTVDVSGNITLPDPVNEIYAGLPFTSTLITHEIAVIINGKQNRGRPIQLKKVTADLLESVDMIVNGQRIPTRFLGPDILDKPLIPVTGGRTVVIRAAGSNAKQTEKLTFTVSEPVQATLRGYTLEYDSAGQ